MRISLTISIVLLFVVVVAAVTATLEPAAQK
jgi:hypothetical protein